MRLKWESRHGNKFYDICGATATSMSDVAAVLTKALATGTATSMSDVAAVLTKALATGCNLFDCRFH